MVRNVETLAELREVITNKDKSIVKFGAEWCQPCKRLAPHLDKVSETVTVIDVDIEKADEGIREAFPIMSVPTVYLFENGDRVRELSGRTAIRLLQEIN